MPDQPEAVAVSFGPAQLSASLYPKLRHLDEATDGFSQRHVGAAADPGGTSSMGEIDGSRSHPALPRTPRLHGADASARGCQPTGRRRGIVQREVHRRPAQRAPSRRVQSRLH